MMSQGFWAAMIAIGAITYLTRALPFLLPERQGARRAPAWLDALGPAILAAMAVSVLLPEGRAAMAAVRLWPFGVGLAATAGVMIWRRDAGLATVAGVIAYWVMLIAQGA